MIIAVPLTYNLFLPQHAKSRIDTFLNPESDQWEKDITFYNQNLQ